MLVTHLGSTELKFTTFVKHSVSFLPLETPNAPIQLDDIDTLLGEQKGTATDWKNVFAKHILMPW